MVKVTTKEGNVPSNQKNEMTYQLWQSNWSNWMVALKAQFKSYNFRSTSHLSNLSLGQWIFVVLFLDEHPNFQAFQRSSKIIPHRYTETRLWQSYLYWCSWWWWGQVFVPFRTMQFKSTCHTSVCFHVGTLWISFCQISGRHSVWII